MQFNKIRETAHRLLDLPVGIIAILALRGLSREGRVAFSWQFVEQFMRTCAADILQVTLVEHDPDEPVDVGFTAVPHDDHVHWEPMPSLLDPVISLMRSEIHEKVAAESMRKQMADALKVFATATNSEPAEVSLPFDLNAVGMGLDLSSPDALKDSLERVLGREVNMVILDGEPEADLADTDIGVKMVSDAVDEYLDDPGSWEGGPLDTPMDTERMAPFAGSDEHVCGCGAAFRNEGALRVHTIDVHADEDD